MADLSTELRWAGYSPGAVLRMLDMPPCDACEGRETVPDETDTVDVQCGPCRGTGEMQL